MKKHSVEYKGRIYVFENTRGETDTMFIERCWFIVKNFEKYKYDFELLESLSYLWVNKKYLKCDYADKQLEECNGVYDKIC